MVNTVNNNPGVNRAFSEMLQNNPALKTEDGVQQVDRLYTNSRGEVKQSSNAISHAFRKLVGKPVGAEAVRHALTQHCLLYTSPSPRDATLSRMPSSA